MLTNQFVIILTAISGLAVIGYLVSTYNGLVSIKNEVDRAWAKSK